MRIPNEIKAGSVIVLAIALAVFFFLKTASFDTKTYAVKTHFGYAGDLKENATVKLAGIEVGRLKTIKFSYENGTQVECLLELTEKAKLRTDSIAYIGTAGFVGDAYIGLTAGENEEFVAPGGEIKSEDPMQTRLFMKKAEEIANSLDHVLKEIDSLVTDNRPEFEAIIISLKQTTQNFDEFSKDLKQHPWKLMFKGE